MLVVKQTELANHFESEEEDACAAQSSAVGVGLWHARTGTTAMFVVFAKDARARRLERGGDDLCVSVSGPSRPEVMVLDCGDGSYSVAYTCTAIGRYRIAVRLGDAHILGSPFDAWAHDGAEMALAGPGLGHVGGALYEVLRGSMRWWSRHARAHFRLAPAFRRLRRAGAHHRQVRRVRDRARARGAAAHWPFLTVGRAELPDRLLRERDEVRVRAGFAFIAWRRGGGYAHLPRERTKRPTRDALARSALARRLDATLAGALGAWRARASVETRGTWGLVQLVEWRVRAAFARWADRRLGSAILCAARARVAAPRLGAALRGWRWSAAARLSLVAKARGAARRLKPAEPARALRRWWSRHWRALQAARFFARARLRARYAALAAWAAAARKAAPLRAAALRPHAPAGLRAALSAWRVGWAAGVRPLARHARLVGRARLRALRAGWTELGVRISQRASRNAARARHASAARAAALRAWARRQTVARARAQLGARAARRWRGRHARAALGAWRGAAASAALLAGVARRALRRFAFPKLGACLDAWRGAARLSGALAQAASATLLVRLARRRAAAGLARWAGRAWPRARVAVAAAAALRALGPPRTRGALATWSGRAAARRLATRARLAPQRRASLRAWRACAAGGALRRAALRCARELASRARARGLRSWRAELLRARAADVLLRAGGARAVERIALPRAYAAFAVWLEASVAARRARAAAARACARWAASGAKDAVRAWGGRTARLCAMSERARGAVGRRAQPARLAALSAWRHAGRSTTLARKAAAAARKAAAARALSGWRAAAACAVAARGARAAATRMWHADALALGMLGWASVVDALREARARSHDARAHRLARTVDRWRERALDASVRLSRAQPWGAVQRWRAASAGRSLSARFATLVSSLAVWRRPALCRGLARLVAVSAHAQLLEQAAARWRERRATRAWRAWIVGLYGARGVARMRRAAQAARGAAAELGRSLSRWQIAHVRRTVRTCLEMQASARHRGTALARGLARLRGAVLGETRAAALLREAAARARARACVSALRTLRIAVARAALGRVAPDRTIGMALRTWRRLAVAADWQPAAPRAIGRALTLEQQDREALASERARAEAELRCTALTRGGGGQVSHTEATQVRAAAGGRSALSVALASAAAAAESRALAAGASSLAATAATRGAARPLQPAADTGASVRSEQQPSALAAPLTQRAPAADLGPSSQQPPAPHDSDAQGLRAYGDHSAALLAQTFALRRDLHEARYREAHHRYSALEASAAASAYRAQPLGAAAAAQQIESANFQAARLHLARITARGPNANAQLAASITAAAASSRAHATPSSAVPLVARQLAKPTFWMPGL